MIALTVITLLVVSSVEVQSADSSTSVTTITNYDQEVANALAVIDATKSSLSSSVTAVQPVFQNTLTVATSLANTLPNAIVNDKLSMAFARLDAIYSIVSGSSEAFCFQNYAATKSSVLSQARTIYTTCSSTLTTGTNQLLNNIARNLTNLNSLAATAKQKVSVCGTNTLYRLDPTLFNYCLTSATSAFNTQAATLKDGVTSLQTLGNSNIISVATCITNATVRAETLLQGFNDYVKSCLSTSSTASAFTSIIISVQNTVVSTFTSQLTGGTSTISSLNASQTSAGANLNEAVNAVANATSAKSLNVTSALATLATNFTNVSAAFAAAANAFATNTLARTCVSNIKNALSQNINTQANNIVKCMSSIQSSATADLLQLQTSYSQLVAKVALNNIQCLGQVDYLFIDNGLTKCIEDEEADETLNFNFLSYKALTLKQQSALVTTAADNCINIGISTAARQNDKDKLSFEICILKNLRQVYNITW